MIKLPCNFRDMGGIKNRRDQTIKPGLLLRSGEPDELDEAQAAEFLRQYNIKNIVDFRFADECSPQSPHFAGVPRVNIDVLKNAADYVPGFMNFQKIDTFDYAHTYMKAVYRTMVEDEYARRGFREFLNIVLRQRDGALLFHCFAGKDRTGLAAAILLHILDVPEESIMADYLMTNELRREDNLKIIENDRQSGVPEERLEVMNAFLLVRPEYLEEAYAHADRLFGGFGAFISEGLKLTDGEAETLKERYLVE